MAFWISEVKGEVLSRGRIIEISSLWRVGRSAGTIWRSDGREGSIRVVEGRDSGLRIEDTTWLS